MKVETVGERFLRERKAPPLPTDSCRGDFIKQRREVIFLDHESYNMPFSCITFTVHSLNYYIEQADPTIANHSW